MALVKGSMVIASLVVVLVFQVVVTTASETNAKSVDNRPTITVEFVNTLPDNAEFGIRCQSGDGDLGIHQIGANGNYQFKFTNSFWGTTRYWCKVKWSGGQVTFDAYNQSRDNWRCRNTCRWYVAKDNVTGFPKPLVVVPYEF